MEASSLLPSSTEGRWPARERSRPVLVVAAVAADDDADIMDAVESRLPVIEMWRCDAPVCCTSDCTSRKMATSSADAGSSVELTSSGQ